MSLPSEYTIIAGVALLLERNNAFLLYKRNIPGKVAYGLFALPGGTVEHHERITQTACREAAEELGIMVREEAVSLVHVMRFREHGTHALLRSTHTIFMLHVMRISSWEGEPINAEPHKHSELGWFLYDHLPDNLFHVNKRVLECVRNNIFYAEYGWD